MADLPPVACMCMCACVHMADLPPVAYMCMCACVHMADLPPVAYVPAVVKLAPLVVVAMCDLMSDHGADRTEVDRVEMLRPAVVVEAELDLDQCEGEG